MKNKAEEMKKIAEEVRALAAALHNRKFTKEASGSRELDTKHVLNFLKFFGV